LFGGSDQGRFLGGGSAWGSREVEPERTGIVGMVVGIGEGRTREDEFRGGTRD